MSLHNLRGVSRIRACFERAHAENRAALIAYLTHGFPNKAASIEILLETARAGADIIELGIPFSDPSADGPVIAGAMEQALANGASLHTAFDAAQTLRQAYPDIGIVLFGYYNPMWMMTPERFAARCEEVGVDAVLVVDVPLEEALELEGPLAVAQTAIIPLVAPTSDEARIRKLHGHLIPFTYYISTTGITGAERGVVTAERIAQVREWTGSPVAVGFGIKTPADVSATAAYADGVIVGSRLVDESKISAQAVGILVASLRAATKR